MVFEKNSLDQALLSQTASPTGRHNAHRLQSRDSI
jgi:hypothetical protein